MTKLTPPPPPIKDPARWPQHQVIELNLLILGHPKRNVQQLFERQLAHHLRLLPQSPHGHFTP